MNCRVCGRQFDPQGFQVMVPGIAHPFDRVDCALEASTVGLPPVQSIERAPAIRALPAPPAAAPPLPPNPPATSGEGLRPHLVAGMNLALLAAATGATIYLWLQVFGADGGPL